MSAKARAKTADLSTIDAVCLALAAIADRESVASAAVDVRADGRVEIWIGERRIYADLHPESVHPLPSVALAKAISTASETL